MTPSTVADELARPPDTLLGQTLVGRYRLTRRLGEGGMGTVYEATDLGIDKPVAVKVLRDKYLDRPSVAQRLQQEAKLASSIRHEHIIDITDTGATDDGRTFVVMELLLGESLGELLRREGALPEARAVGIARQIAMALGAAHAAGIIHRDVKPENVFLVQGRDREDFVKVVDFGISTIMQREGEDVGRLTSTGMVLGTPFYMSPEQARGDEDVDQRIDVYAVGVILYECLTGEVPFRAANYLAIAARILNFVPVAPRLLRPELRISEAIEAVVTRAMSRRRDDRYATMEELAADLDRVLAGEAVISPRLSDQAQAAPSVDEGGGFGASWIVALVVLLLAGGGALLWASREGVARRAAPSPVAVVAAPPAPGPAMIVVRVETTPPGAEVRQGDRVFGLAPKNVLLPKSSAPTHLTFFLDGYEPGQADVVPLADDTVRVHLTAQKLPKKRPVVGGKTIPLAVPKPTTPPGETLPNPY